MPIDSSPWPRDDGGMLDRHHRAGHSRIARNGRVGQRPVLVGLAHFADVEREDPSITIEAEEDYKSHRQAKGIGKLWPLPVPAQVAAPAFSEPSRRNGCKRHIGKMSDDGSRRLDSIPVGIGALSRWRD